MRGEGQRIPGIGIAYEVSQMTMQVTIRVDAEELMLNAEAKHAVNVLIAMADSARVKHVEELKEVEA